ncbi:MAG: caspase, EACC1-associated type [Gammaproteobacteria bacterium]
MFQRKFAVLVGCTEFPKAGASLPPLPSAMTDVRELESMLQDKMVGGFTDVQVVLDLPHWEVMMRVNQVLHDANRDDQVLLYYSGHGLLDSEGNLFLATSNTEPSLLRSTALPSDALRGLIRDTACRRIIIILDCCYSEAVKRLDIEKIIDDSVERVGRGVGGGYAIAIIAAAATNGHAYAAADGGASVTTKAMLEAIRSGVCDRNRDGVISIEEIYKYTRDKLSADGFPIPHFFETGATGSLTFARSAREYANPDVIVRIRAAIARAKNTEDHWPEAIFERADEILKKPEEAIRDHYEALFSLLRDWANEKLSLSELCDQWYQFDETGLGGADEKREITALANHWASIREARQSIHDLVCPSYILDQNYHFLDWNPMFDELLAKPMGLTRFRHAEDFILKLKNHREVIERSREAFAKDAYPIVHLEDLEYESPKYGLITLKKIAAQIAGKNGGLLAWSINLNILQAEHAPEMWADLERRLTTEVNWSIYAKLYDAMLVHFDPYNELIRKAVSLLGDARSVADLGAGTGNVTIELFRQLPYREVWALESNQEMIELLQRKLPDASEPKQNTLRVFKGDLMLSLREFDQDFLDGAIMVNTLYAIPDRARCLREIYRILKPGGVLVYSTSTDQTDIDRLFDSIKLNLEEKGMGTALREVVELAYERNRAMITDILRDSPEMVVDYARQAGFCVSDDHVFPGEYEGAVTIVRALKPKFLAQPCLPFCPDISDRRPLVFISYAREDRVWCEQIMRYLEPAEQAGKISIWADTEIEHGEKWQEAILNNLEKASLAVLLITTDFLRSEFVREQEMPLLLDKRQRKQLTIIPVMIDQA